MEVLRAELGADKQSDTRVCMSMMSSFRETDHADMHSPGQKLFLIVRRSSTGGNPEILGGFGGVTTVILRGRHAGVSVKARQPRTAILGGNAYAGDASGGNHMRCMPVARSLG